MSLFYMYNCQACLLWWSVAQNMVTDMVMANFNFMTMRNSSGTEKQQQKKTFNMQMSRWFNEGEHKSTGQSFYSCKS